MNLSEIRYPVFRLSDNSPNDIDDVVFYISERHTEDEVGDIITDTKLQIVDDRNMPGATLATRRLTMKAMGIKLYPLRKAIFFLGDLIKSATPNTYFIDSNGKTFQYKKNTRAALQCKLITNNIPIPTGGSIIEIDHAMRFKTVHNVDPTNKYAGVLKFDNSLVLYGVYQQPFKDSWRMV